MSKSHENTSLTIFPDERTVSFFLGGGEAGADNINFPSFPEISENLAHWEKNKNKTKHKKQKQKQKNKTTTTLSTA